MPLETLTTTLAIKELATHFIRWLANLNRANEARQKQSLRAVSSVVTLVRKSSAYSRGLKRGKQDFNTEADLAAQWSVLSFELAELKLNALAKKCDLKSRYWADPAQFTPEFLAQADISFESVERLARNLVIKIKHGSHST